MATIPPNPNESIEPGKLFIGGISWETDEEKLCGYFKKFGEIVDCKVMRDPYTPKEQKKHRGFGFVKFSDPACVEFVLSQGPHMLDGKQIDPKQATLKNTQQGPPGGGGGGGDRSGNVAKKIFVGGLPQDVTEDNMRTYFSNIGIVKSVDLKYDKTTNRMRGFGFVEFDTEEAVAKAVEVRYHSLNGKSVEVKKAQPQPTGGGGFRPQLQYGGGQYGYGQGAPQQYQQPGGAYAGYSQGMYNFTPQYYPQQYSARQYGAANQGYENTYTSGNYRGGGFDSTGYSGAQQTSGGAAGQMYGQVPQVDQSSYQTTGRSGYTSAADGYASQSGYGYGSYPYQQQQDTSQRGAGSYARGSQPQQQSSYYSTH